MRRRSRGAAMLVALALLAMVFLIAAALLQQLASQQRVARDHQRRLQASYLAESALDRAAAQVARDPQYAGETWQPKWEVGNIEQEGSARIEIQREPARQVANVIVSVQFPIHPVNRVQAVIRRTIPLPAAD